MPQLTRIVVLRPWTRLIRTTPAAIASGAQSATKGSSPQVRIPPPQALPLSQPFTGDVLFYPEDYWHQTIGLDPGNAAVSGTLVTPSNANLVADELQVGARVAT